MNNWKDGLWPRAPIHLATWGLGAILAQHYLGPFTPFAFVLGEAIRGEYQDWKDKDDTLGKSLIDAASQILLPLIGVLHYVVR